MGVFPILIVPGNSTISFLSYLQIPKIRPAALGRLAKSERTVSRAYGGSRCATCTRSRVLRAFIIEEQKIVKKVLLEKMKSKKETA